MYFLKNIPALDSPCHERKIVVILMISCYDNNRCKVIVAEVNEKRVNFT